MVAECFACESDMTEAAGCDPDRTITIGKKEYDAIPYGDGDRWDDLDFEASGRCHDCGANVGEIHHPGCDMEECPECGGQYFICDCWNREKERIWGPQ